jgi:hypothetical protein
MDRTGEIKHETARPKFVKITKVGAGYVHRAGSDYRCSECIHFLSDIKRCFLLGSDDVIAPEGYCIEWAKGARPADDHDWDDKPQGCYSKAEVGYGTKKNGTLCERCKHFDAGYCEIVEGRIEPGGCCNSQSPA